MNTETKSKKSPLSSPLSVAIMVLFGAGLVALLINGDRLMASRREKSKPEKQMVEEVKGDEKSLTFCDAVKALTLDAPKGFNHSLLKLKSSDNIQDIWKSIHEVKGIEIVIIFDKEENTKRAEMKLYQGGDSTAAKRWFERYTTLLDACLKVRRGNVHDVDHADEESNWNEYWYEYRGETYSVELKMFTSRTEDILTSVSVVVRKGRVEK